MGFTRGLGRVFSFGLLRDPVPEPQPPEAQLARAFETLDAAFTEASSDDPDFAYDGTDFDCWFDSSADEDAGE